MHEVIVRILKEIKPAIDLSGEQKFMDSKALDSFDIVMLIGEIDEAFDIQIVPSDIIPDNFNSVDAIVKLVQSLQD